MNRAIEKKIGTQTILSRTRPGRWLVRCACGNERECSTQTLYAFKKRLIAGCRKCLKARFDRRVDRAGQRFGKWTVVTEASRHGSQIIFLCRCDCGQPGYVWQANLLSGASTGCRKCRLANMRKFRLGVKVGKNIITKESTRDSAGELECTECGYRRPIRVISKITTGCRKCMGPSPGPGGIRIELNGVTKNIAQWAREVGIHRETMRLRLRRGVPKELALTAPKYGQMLRSAT